MLTQTPRTLWRRSESGDVAVLGRYLDELVPNLRVVAGLLDPDDDQQPHLVFDGTRPQSVAEQPQEDSGSVEDDEDWEGDTRQFRQAIANERPELIGSYLNDAAKLLHQLRRVLDTDKRSHEQWQLVLQRRRQGKPSEDPLRAMVKQTKIRTLVWSAQRRLGKLDAAIHAVCTEQGLSRATVWRALGAKRSKSPESHKRAK